MKNEASDLTNVLDQSVLSSLRQLQDEGDPDIVPDVGGLFLQHSREYQSHPGGGGKKRCQGLPARSLQPQVQQRPRGSHAPLRMAKELEMIGRSATWKELERARRSCQSSSIWPSRLEERSWLRLAAEAR